MNDMAGEACFEVEQYVETAGAWCSWKEIPHSAEGMQIL